jgi:NCAIR mutase (PurE)-related protein
MDEPSLLHLLETVAAGETTPDQALQRVRSLPFADLGFARVDHHRQLRQGFPEAVYGPGKTPEHCRAIVTELLEGPTTGPVLLTRAGPELAAEVQAGVPGGTYHDVARLVVWRPAPPAPTGTALIACAGTADLPVAEEAAATLAALGWPPARCNDVGVAGLHRLLADEDRLRSADVVIVVAGMEGALASAVGGLVGAPVVAVPTSVGYGSSLEGITALLAMLASCAPGVAVVGIDNGFGAACAAARILGTLRKSAET